jgi:hypothetical protein
VEVLLAVALLGALLLAMNVFIFSLGEIWGRNRGRRLFDQHVRAVTRHVEGLLRRAALTPPDGQAAAIAVREIRTDGGATEPLLAFTLPEGDRLLPWPRQPLPEVAAALTAAEGRGLVLLWHSRLETDFAERPPRAFVLTPWVTALSYEYYQSEFKNWQSQPRLRRDNAGNWLAPDAIRLRFSHHGMTAETLIVLPATSDALPHF